ncbi:MAG: hypothetical protein M3082_11640 [Candidatus Dormibacteraeota bacterium]|nr:hypothetical protein [Candidatus Dormibacteraeota bacterium]
MIKSNYTPDRNRDFNSTQKSEGAKLNALVEQCASDLAKLELALDKAGYSQDSAGQFFKDGVIVPSPSFGKATGITPFTADLK